MLNVSTRIMIRRPRADVADFAADPVNAPRWYVNIGSVEWRTPPPLRVGSRIAFVARFLGRRISYTYEVTDFVPRERLVMSAATGPFAMETSYTWEDAAGGHTMMSLRNRGGPGGIAPMLAPLMAAAVRSANRRDLQRLKTILEDERGGGGDP